MIKVGRYRLRFGKGEVAKSSEVLSTLANQVFVGVVKGVG
jgi:hypothetical protein